MIYTERIETGLRHENDTLRGQLADVNLDIADAVKSRRDLQQRVVELEHQVGVVSSANEHLKVHYRVGTGKLMLRATRRIGTRTLPS